MKYIIGKNLMILATASAFLGFGCASSEMKSIERSNPSIASPIDGQPATGNTVQTKFIAAEQGAHTSTEFNFRKGTNVLTHAAKRMIDKAIKEASARGKISGIKVIAWGDLEYPATAKNDPPPVEVALAQRRLQVIADYLVKIASSAEIEKISMAIRPDKLATFLKTSDSRIKKSVEKAGIAVGGEGQKGPSMGRKAIILISNQDQLVR